MVSLQMLMKATGPQDEAGRQLDWFTAEALLSLAWAALRR